jgi:hypothetical protein
MPFTTNEARKPHNRCVGSLTTAVKGGPLRPPVPCG